MVNVLDPVVCHARGTIGACDWMYANYIVAGGACLSCLGLLDPLLELQITQSDAILSIFKHLVSAIYHLGPENCYFKYSKYQSFIFEWTIYFGGIQEARAEFQDTGPPCLYTSCMLEILWTESFLCHGLTMSL